MIIRERIALKGMKSAPEALEQMQQDTESPPSMGLAQNASINSFSGALPTDRQVRD
jgi:hypothetical protein